MVHYAHLARNQAPPLKSAAAEQPAMYLQGILWR